MRNIKASSDEYLWRFFVLLHSFCIIAFKALVLSAQNKLKTLPSSNRVARLPQQRSSTLDMGSTGMKVFSVEQEAQRYFDSIQLSIGSSWDQIKRSQELLKDSYKQLQHETLKLLGGDQSEFTIENLQYKLAEVQELKQRIERVEDRLESIKKMVVVVNPQMGRIRRSATLPRFYGRATSNAEAALMFSNRSLTTDAADA